MNIKAITATAVFASMSAMAGIDTNLYHEIDHKTATEQEFRAVYDAMMATTNNQDLYEISRITKFLRIAWRADLRDLTLEFDNGLSLREGANLCMLPLTYVYSFPKLTEVRLISNGIVNDYSRTFAYAKSNNCDATPRALAQEGGAGVDVLVTYLDEMVAFSTNINHYGVGGIANIEAVKTWIQNKASKELKRKMRMAGISFVTKNGVNPCDAYMTALNTALNAPRLNGLNEWLATLGYSSRIDVSKLPTENDVKEIKDAVFFGDREANARDKAILYICLGSDGYNSFVKEFNGDK